MENEILSMLENDMRSVLMHEFKNCLALIQGNLQAMAENHQEIKESRHWLYVQDELHLMDELLAESKFIYKNLRNQFSYGNLLEPLECVLEENSNSSYIRQKQLSFYVDISDEVYEAADGYQFHFFAMKAAYVNLIKNAIEACEEGGNLSIKAELSQENGDTILKISICNSGKTLSKEELEQIFILDYTSKISGSGIGLPVVKYIMDEHQFCIHAESENNKICFNLSTVLKEW